MAKFLLGVAIVAFMSFLGYLLAKKYRKVGAGLGLYICKTLLNAHNGDITVESKPNTGTTFTFTLPKIKNF